MASGGSPSKASMPLAHQRILHAQAPGAGASQTWHNSHAHYIYEWDQELKQKLGWLNDDVAMAKRRKNRKGENQK